MGKDEKMRFPQQMIDRINGVVKEVKPCKKCKRTFRSEKVGKGWECIPCQMREFYPDGTPEDYRQYVWHIVDER